MTDDRFVGRAEPRPPRRDDPPTEPLFLPPPQKPRPVGLILGLIAGAFILLLIGIMAGFAFRLGGNANQGAVPAPAPSPTAKPASPTPTPDGPSAVTEKFLTAMRAGDEAGMQKHLCAPLRDDGAGASKKPDSGFGWLSLGTLVSFKIGEEKVNALGAAVQVELTVPLVGTSNLEVFLVREAGGWRVCGAGPV